MDQKPLEIKIGEYTEIWEPCEDLYCPNCGKKSVWHECSDGDYYLHELHQCINCKYTFHLPSCCPPNINDEKRIIKIREYLEKLNNE